MSDDAPKHPDETCGPIKIENRSVSELVPFARNSRTHSDAQVAQIASSIREFGWTNPILVDGSNGIIAGHGRLLAARKLSMREVPVIVLDHLTDAQKRALVIADNKLALNAGWDAELLSSEIEGLGQEGFDLSLLGFSEDELAGLLVDKTEGLTDPDDIPEAPADPVSVLGDVWVLGKHRIVCGDSTDADTVAKCMKRPIENNSSPGQAVYEPFSGSGTTIIAGEMTGRCIHAIELNPAYVDVAVKRWQEFTGEQGVHAETGETFDAMTEGRLNG